MASVGASRRLPALKHDTLQQQHLKYATKAAATTASPTNTTTDAIAGLLQSLDAPAILELGLWLRGDALAEIELRSAAREEGDEKMDCHRRMHHSAPVGLTRGRRP